MTPIMKIIPSAFVAGWLMLYSAIPVSADYAQDDSFEYVPAVSAIAEDDGSGPPAETEPVTGPAAPQHLQYKVSAGDTLSKISRDFELPMQVLMDVNDIHNPNMLHTGQQLVIPMLAESMNVPEGMPPVVCRVLTSTLTAYTAGYESTGKTPTHPEYGITYSGSKAVEGRTIAVDPSVIPLGSTVYIEGIGIRKAEDTGSAIRGPKIDVFLNDVNQATHFGVKKNVRVFVLESETA